jgi:molybdenum cofactor cytidylyltransferase
MADNAKHIAAVLLAAGAGKRFGGDKLLHPLDDGVAIAAHAARNLLAVLPDVVAVVRWGDFPLYDMLEQEGCRVTMFQGAARGMGASLAHGVGEARSADGWIIALADMPRVPTGLIREIAAALEKGASIVAPVHGGERGHPVVQRAAARGTPGARRDAGPARFSSATRGIIESSDAPASCSTSTGGRSRGRRRRR